VACSDPGKNEKTKSVFFYKSGKGKMKESTKSETMTMMTEKIQPYLKYAPPVLK
jgi:hypothetical protein